MATTKEYIKQFTDFEVKLAIFFVVLISTTILFIVLISILALIVESIKHGII